MISPKRSSNSDSKKTSTKKKVRGASGDAAAGAAAQPIADLGDPQQYLQHGSEGLRAEIGDKPFRHWVCKDFLEEEFARRLKSEILNEKFNEKNNDLYTFRQTNDLKVSKQAHVVALRNLLYGQQFLDIMRKLTGIELNDTVDMASLRFSQTDNLLCHDDELEGRRIAYILYLVPKTWTAKDGGSLDLFDCDDQQQPRNVVTRLVPQWNSFSFFEVSPVSYHQVAEIVSPDKERVSISGWFHGAPIERPPPAIERPLIHFHGILSPKNRDLDEAVEADLALLASWINPRYLLRRTQAKISSLFTDQSSIELPDFLREDKFEDILRVIAYDKSWERVGPPNRRNYERLPQLDPSAFNAPPPTGPRPRIMTPDGEVEGDPLVELRMFLQSRAFVSFLQRMTNVDIAEVGGEARRFFVGHYTLLTDSGHGGAAAAAGDEAGAAAAAPVLDAVLSFSPEWDESWGGGLTYVHGDVELLTVWPGPNRLSLVYRLPGGQRYVKYVNCLANIPRFDCSYEYVCEPYSSDDSDSENGSVKVNSDSSDADGDYSGRQMLSSDEAEDQDDDDEKDEDDGDDKYMSTEEYQALIRKSDQEDDDEEEDGDYEDMEA